MSEDSQILLPPSFVALFIAPGRSRPSAGRAEIAARHDLCEDLAQMLIEQAATQQWQLGVTETDVLERCERGLLADAGVVTAAEARWVMRRLAELLGWPDPGPGPAPAADQAA